MTEVYTYSYIKDLLSRVNDNNKLKWSDFLLILKYLNIKLDNIDKLKKKKILVITNKAIVYEILNRLYTIVNLKQVENDMALKQMTDILKEIRLRLDGL